MKEIAKKETFDIPTMKRKIEETQPDEVCILSGGFANYFDVPQSIWQWLEEKLNIHVYINDYQDLECDPHNIR